MTERSAQVKAAAAKIREAWSGQPEVAIVLGTGSSLIADAVQIEAELPYQEIPHFPRSTAIGHAGRLLCGRFGRYQVVAMKGRFHQYEGYSVAQVALPIDVFAELGVRRLLLTNAAGGLNPKFAVGDIMLIDSHIDLFFRQYSRLLEREPPAKSLRNNPRIDLAYCEMMMQQALQVGRAQDIVLHRGTYVGLLGPCYETRAEYRMLRRIGGDAVGMSTIPEVVAAARHQLPVLAASIITNVASLDAPQTVSGHSVVEAGNQAAGAIAAIFAALLNYSPSRGK